MDCLADGDCTDDSYCNGTETCGADGTCVPGDDPCAGGLCIDELDACVDCLTDAD